ncbi:MAG: hypothetical protein K5662_05975 [Lachnospiraceae bacterium]|nr:hypothetical protein [Lachnospiraceae bacterium]
MDRVFDIHNHILPGVDDGSKDMDMSLRMLKIAAEDGITDIILTPHNKPNRRNLYTDELKAHVAELEKLVSDNGLNIRLYAGNEVYYRSDIFERLSIGKASAMAGSRYVLIEFSPADDWDYIKSGIYSILSEGYLPIIAHVERYINVVDHPERAYELKSMGCVIQLNADSVMGELGYKVKQFCKKMLKDRKVDLIASDAHNDGKRSPKLHKCISKVASKYGEETAVRIFRDNPMKIINDEYI